MRGTDVSGVLDSLLNYEEPSNHRRRRRNSGAQIHRHTLPALTIGMLGRLPLTLLSLLLITLSASSEPTTPIDPFRPIVLRIPKQTEPPICCLKAPQNLEPADDDVLLSFEEWKAKQSQRQVQADANPEAAERGNNRSGSAQVNDSKGGERGSDMKEGSTLVEDVGSAMHVGSEGGPHSTEALLPHFRVPITDRFNYASLDCSARVHATHKGAKSSSSILSSKKDRYMLSPCQKSSAHQFVVVELCEDIKIDTVQMANFEFFSGVFKDFSVSVAKTYNGPWADAGMYRAKNIRGVQVSVSTNFNTVYTYVLRAVLPYARNRARLLPVHSYRLSFPLR